MCCWCSDGCVCTAGLEKGSSLGRIVLIADTAQSARIPTDTLTSWNLCVCLNIKGSFGSQRNLSRSVKFKFKTTPFILLDVTFSRHCDVNLCTLGSNKTPESSCLSERELDRRVVYLIIYAGCVYVYSALIMHFLFHLLCVLRIE